MKSFILLIFLFFATFQIYSQDTINVPADYTTIQAAIDVAVNGDIVLVADGLYYENIKYRGKAITVASHFLVDGDTSHISNTIINGSQPSHIDSGSVVYFISGEDTTSMLCGFTITEGYNGGIECENSGMKIINNNITTNSSIYGGGIFIEAESNQCNIVIEKNTINNNIASGHHGNSGHGGGIYIDRISGTFYGRISNNFIAHNLAGPAESGYSDGQRGLLGAGIYIRNCSPLISNNIIIENNIGGGVSIQNAQPILINNTIVNNNDYYGGGISIDENSNPILINSILWNNTTEIDLRDSSSLTISHSDIKGGLSGIIVGGGSTVYWLDGNIDAYPEFVDTANGDFHLTDNSPCIGAAIDSIEIAGTWYYCPLTDFEGRPRPNPVGTMPDMGAYENGPVVGVEDKLNFPISYKVFQNFPNPFNSSTKIQYSIQRSSKVAIKIFDILGNEIETMVKEEKPAGTYEIIWYAEGLPSGIYFYQLRAGDFVETKKMILLK